MISKAYIDLQRDQHKKVFVEESFKENENEHKKKHTISNFNLNSLFLEQTLLQLSYTNKMD